MGRRIVAVAIVVVSACTALHYSTTSQSAVTIATNPYHFSSPSTMTFTISPKGSSDHDILQSIQMQCASQWMINTGYDVQQPVMGANVCGFGGPGSGSTGSQLFTDGFAQCPANYQFQISYNGTLPGLDSCNVVITSMPYGGGSAQFYTLMMTGSGSAASGITVKPGAIDFGQQPINTTSSPQQIEVKNVGSASIQVTSSLSGNGFQVTNLGTTNIGPGSAAFYNATCMPTQAVGYTGMVTFATNVNTLQTTLNCTGVISDALVAPAPITFADTLVGRPPPNRTATITGTAAATIQTVTLDANATAAGVTIVSNPQGMAIGTGKNVVLAYSAAAAHTSGPLGKLSVKVSTDTNPLDVTINGEALLGGVGTNPANIDFGAVCIGSVAMETIEVFANEPGDVVVSQLTAPSAPFSAIALETLPKTLAGNHAGPSVMVRATLTPTAAGVFEDKVSLTSDVPNKPTTEVELTGIVLAGGIAATPNVVNFGTAAIGATTSIKEVQLTNCGTGPLMFNRVSIAGRDAGEFTLIGANPARTLQPTESELFMVVMQPESSGYKTAQLIIEHSEGMTLADLDGTGDGELTGGKDRETYYACSTGRSSAWWPIALALLALRRRRR